MKINEELIQLLQECLTKELKCFVWDIVENRLTKIPVKISSVNRSKKILIFKFEDEHLLNFDEIISGSGKMSIWIPDHEIFFQSNLLEFSKEGFLRLDFPKEYEKKDRRTKDRHLAQKMVIFNYEYMKRKSSRLCYDIGNGGFSIVYVKSEMVPFKSGEIIQGSSLNVLGEIFEFDVKVVNKLRVKPFKLNDLPYAGWRVSFKIIQPSKKYIEKIQNLFNHLESSKKAN